MAWFQSLMAQYYIDNAHGKLGCLKKVLTASNSSLLAWFQSLMAQYFGRKKSDGDKLQSNNWFKDTTPYKCGGWAPHPVKWFWSRASHPSW